MTDTISYREPVPVYKDIWNWDIVLLHGDVKIIGNTDDHMDSCVFRAYGVQCTCQDGPTLSSPVVDKNGRRLREGSAYSLEPQTGDGKIYLDAGPGSKIPVLSGKVYRLCGERGHHDAYAPGSIWVVCKDRDPIPKIPKTNIGRFTDWIFRW